MRKKLLTLTIIAGSLFLGACAEDSTMDELLQEDIELNETGDPDDDDPDDTGNPGSGVNGGNGG